MLKNELVEAIRKALETEKPRSAWDKGVKEYAFWILEKVAEFEEMPENTNAFRLQMLNGARDWQKEPDRNGTKQMLYHWLEASYGGCYLVYDGDIAKTLCTPSELKKVQHREGGYKKPNSHENWLECQGRALYQAGLMLENIYKEVAKNV